MDSFADMLKERKPSEPPQLQALRLYVKENHRANVAVSVSQMGYTLTVPSAPLAATLRMELPIIQDSCKLDKKLFIRIGHF